MRKPTNPYTKQEKAFLDELQERASRGSMQPPELLRAGLEFALAIRQLVWSDIERGDIEMAQSLERRHLHKSLWLTTRMDEING